MKMPIVSRQKMSMNESVAATCCFRKVVSPTNYYQEVLSGGALASSPQLTWKTGIPQEWSLLDFDVDFSKYEGNTPVPYYNNLLRGWWVLYFDKNTIVYASPIDGLLGDPNVPVTVTNEGCNHATDSCLYITYTQDSEMHVGATKGHATDGGDFARAHAAMQFNS